MNSVIETDALIVGAGPVGLFQAFQLGLQELQSHIVDALPEPGGQCVELYADKPIYDIPALPVASGRKLVELLLAQVRPVKPVFHLGQLVSELHARADGRFEAATDAGTRFIARVVVVAAGVGAFVPRRLMLEAARPFEGHTLVYSVGDLDANAGRDVVVLGDGQDAIDTVVSLASRDEAGPRSLALLHRRDSFRADAQSVARMQALRAAGRLDLLIGQPVGFEAMATDASQLASLRWIDVEGALHDHRCERAIALLGVSPKLGPIADWGLGLERKQVPVSTESFETQLPGLYAVGDINHYPGKRKLIVSGFHEATLAAFAAAQRLRPDERIATLYTTTSEKLQRLLGVNVVTEAIGAGGSEPA